MKRKTKKSATRPAEETSFEKVCARVKTGTHFVMVKNLGVRITVTDEGISVTIFDDVHPMKASVSSCTAYYEDGWENQDGNV